MCVHGCRHMCMEVWGHICVPLCRGQRTILSVTHQQNIYFTLTQVSFLLGTCHTGEVGRPVSPGGCMSAPFQHWDYMNAPPHMAFWCASGEQTQALLANTLPTFCLAQANNLDFYHCLVLCFPLETCFLVVMCVYMFIYECVQVHMYVSYRYV